MNLLKRWRKEEDGGGALSRQQHRGESPLTRFRDEMDRMFDRVWHEFGRDPLAAGPEMANWPAIDVSEDDHKVTLRVDVPGLEAKDVDVEVSGNLLSISGTRQEETSDESGGLHRRERRVGQFSRTLTLPSYVEPDKVEAHYDKGVLTITAPKQPGKGPRRVQVAE